MKRSMIFGLVLAALVLNLALGANLYINGARTATNADNPQPSPSRFLTKPCRRFTANMWMARI